LLGFRVALVISDEHLLLLFEESQHLIIFELKIVTDQVASGFFEFFVDLGKVSFAQLSQNSPEDLGYELTRGHKGPGD